MTDRAARTGCEGRFRRAGCTSLTGHRPPGRAHGVRTDGRRGTAWRARWRDWPTTTSGTGGGRTRPTGGRWRKDPDMADATLYLEDVAEGDEAPELTHVLTGHPGALNAGASGDYNPMHHDEVLATAAGQPSVFGHGMFSMGLLGTALTDVVGAGQRDAATRCGSPARRGPTRRAALQDRGHGQAHRRRRPPDRPRRPAAQCGGRGEGRRRGHRRGPHPLLTVGARPGGPAGVPRRSVDGGYSRLPVGSGRRTRPGRVSCDGRSACQGGLWSVDGGRATGHAAGARDVGPPSRWPPCSCPAGPCWPGAGTSPCSRSPTPATPTGSPPPRSGWGRWAPRAASPRRPSPRSPPGPPSTSTPSTPRCSYGRKIVYAPVVDDGTSPSGDTAGAQRLVQSNVFAVVGVGTPFFTGSSILRSQAVPTFGIQENTNVQWSGPTMFGAGGSYIADTLPMPQVAYVAQETHSHVAAVLAYNVAQSSGGCGAVVKGLARYHVKTPVVDFSIPYGAATGRRRDPHAAEPAVLQLSFLWDRLFIT